MTLANKTGAVRHWLQREGWDGRPRNRGQWEFCLLAPCVANIVKVSKDEKFKSSLWRPSGLIVKDILRPGVSVQRN